jgi:hypothetical protein
MINEYYQVLNSLYEDIDFTEDWKVYPVRFEPAVTWYIEDNILFFKFQEEEQCLERIYSYPEDDDGWIEYDVMKPWRFYTQVIYPGTKYTGVLVDTREDGNYFLMIFLNENKQN